MREHDYSPATAGFVVSSAGAARVLMWAFHRLGDASADRIGAPPRAQNAPAAPSPPYAQENGPIERIAVVCSSDIASRVRGNCRATHGNMPSPIGATLVNRVKLLRMLCNRTGAGGTIHSDMRGSGEINCTDYNGVKRALFPHPLMERT